MVHESLKPMIDNDATQLMVKLFWSSCPFWIQLSLVPSLFLGCIRMLYLLCRWIYFKVGCFCFKLYFNTSRFVERIVGSPGHHSLQWPLATLSLGLAYSLYGSGYAHTQAEGYASFFCMVFFHYLVIACTTIIPTVEL